MKSDLRNLVTAQEGFFSDNQDYAGGTAATQTNGVGGAGKVAFSPSQGNTVTVNYTNAAGWSATAVNPAVTSAANDKCGIFVGDPATYSGGAGLAATDVEGAPKCY